MRIAWPLMATSNYMTFKVVGELCSWHYTTCSWGWGVTHHMIFHQKKPPTSLFGLQNTLHHKNTGKKWHISKWTSNKKQALWVVSTMKCSETGKKTKKKRVWLKGCTGVHSSPCLLVLFPFPGFYLFIPHPMSFALIGCCCTSSPWYQVCLKSIWRRQHVGGSVELIVWRVWSVTGSNLGLLSASFEIYQRVQLKSSKYRWIYLCSTESWEKRKGWEVETWLEGSWEGK